jgi:hypothetical protein
MAGVRAGARAALDAPSAQRRSVRMQGVAWLVLADLPVDLVVVLEQQERTGHAYSTERALRKLGFRRVGEHVFVSYEAVRTDSLRTCVRVAPPGAKWLCRAISGLMQMQQELQP